MEKDHQLHDVEKTGVPVAISALGIEADSRLETSPDQKSTATSRNPSLDEDQHEHDQIQDLEALSTIQSSGPPYSVFSKSQKRFIVFLVAWGGFFSPLSANIYFPALNTLAREMHVSNSLINLTLTSYMIFQGLAPTIFGDLADMAGRRPAYAIGLILYVGACIGLALQNSFAALFILRCLQSSGSSSTIALGNGVVADIATSSERGTWMGYATSGPMIAPAVGPVIGGLLAQFLGWRSIFWFLVIMSAAYMIPFFICFPETARNVVGNGSIPPQGWNMSLLNWLETRKAKKAEGQLTPTVSRDESRAAQAELASKRKLRFPNPLGTLHVMFEKDVGLLLLFNSLVYTAFYDVIASVPYLFEQIYGFNDLQIGLSFIPFGFGALCAPLTCGRLMDWNYRRLAKKAGVTIDRKRGDDLKKIPIERARIQVAIPLVYLGNAALLCYGWVVEVETSLAVPLVLHFIMGIGLSGAFNCMSVLLVDFYPLSPATATAANNLARCLLGAAGTAIIQIMIDSMGRGWCFTFIAAVVFCTSPILLVLMRWGPGWRESRRKRLEDSQASSTRP
ncbi:MFS general substrate transporter [Mytilinidion resinicola]|uniref:MFS general substrate transporter n=1 Tax=Mytilinidion resinicola TaxID=574789 RepID=A0A6A6YA41_9PEZI|nr:MFS general substrate transporter [Mytilinidion resinicola]KAF2805692.1 MFS general substrate transporter [Mytilinidion resinicola]